MLPRQIGSEKPAPRLQKTRPFFIEKKFSFSWSHGIEPDVKKSPVA